LLIIETFFHQKLNKTKTKDYIGIWGFFWYYWKAFDKSNLIDFISQFFRSKVWKILIFKWILLLEIQTNFKNWVWKEKTVEVAFAISTCATLVITNK
jgi:hypothetical protein